MPRRSPFADLHDGPADNAVVVEIGRPSRAALGCFGLTTVFLAVISLAAIGYAAFRPAASSGAARGLAGVLGAIFLVLVAGLVVVGLRAARVRQGLAFDAEAAWWRSDRTLVRLPWASVAAVQLVEPVRVRGLRTSAPKAPAAQLTTVDEPTLRQLLRDHPRLVDAVISGEPVGPGLPGLRLSFRLSTPDDGARVAGAIGRFAPDLWLPEPEKG